MKLVWLYYLPLLFLPNLGFETETPFGTLTMSDYLIAPYIVLVFLAGQPEWVHRFQFPQKLFVHLLLPTFLLFVWWAAISSLSISFRYDYGSLNPVYFSLLKIGKLSLYGFAAILTIRALSKVDSHAQGQFLWAILASGVLVGLTLLLSGNSLQSILPSDQAASDTQLFQENPTSVMLSMLIVFMVAMLLEGNGSERWRRYASVGIIIMVLGFFLANGRGGWLAALAGSVYIGININIKRTIRLLVFGSLILIFTYNQYPSFQEQVDKTLSPDPVFLEEYNAGVFGIDDGARLIILATEAPKLLDDPLFGRGFFHRGGQSGLFSTGSHNFFLQMFLETGFVGGIALIVLFIQMWQHASSSTALQKKLSLPVKASLVAAVVSGLSGEYFYGGMVLFAFLLTYAPVGSLTAVSSKVTQPSSITVKATNN